MAFQQPQQRPQAPRPSSFSKQINEQAAPASPARKRTLEESHEWILFSPVPHADERSHTPQTPRTATHRSEFGSLETHVRSQPFAHSQDVGEPTYLGTDIDDENAELDSLDDGLHAFHHPFSASSNPLDQSGGTVLPTHDGLGTFPSSAGLQEQLWQFERYNPHRKRHIRRRSSIQKKLDEVEEEQELDVEDERIARVEKWRLDQSRAVLEEIERETRRRRRQKSRMSGASTSMDTDLVMQDSIVARGAPRVDSVMTDGPETIKSEVQQPTESFWRRITRRVIQDLIGLDETTLSVIFGEQLLEDASPTPTQPSPLAAAARQESRVSFQDSGYSWEVKLLQRVANELGVLVHQLSEHDGALSTYRQTHEEPEYAGLPHAHQRQPSLRQQRRRQSQQGANAPSETLFSPTIPMGATDTSLWGIEEEPSQPLDDVEAAKLRQEQEYWERDVNVNMILSYLKRRFSSKPPAPEAAGGPLPASWATTAASALGTSPESLRRAEVIRRQHPLVSRATERAAAQARRRESLLRRHHMQTLIQKRAGSSSCASQSTKRSRRTRSGSSRHYWDLGGSVGSVGSGPARSSGLGGWGEV